MRGICLVFFLLVGRVSLLIAAAQGTAFLRHSLLNPATNTSPVLSAALDGSIAVASDRGDASVAAFVYDAGTGALLHTLTNPSPTPDASFRSTAVAGTLVIAAQSHPTVAYVYDLAGATPGLPVLMLPDAGPGWRNYYVGISNRRVALAVVRAFNPDEAMLRVFDLASTTPTAPMATINLPGYSAVAIDGNRLVIGASLEDTTAQDSGTVYVYDLTSATPTVPGFTLPNPSPGALEYFGQSVAILADRVIVGAHRDNTGEFGAGIAYVYDLTTAMPTLPVFALTNPSPRINDGFGSAVVISGTRVAVGAGGDDTGAVNTGIVYVFDLTNSMPTLPVMTLNNPSPHVSDGFGYQMAFSGSRLLARGGDLMHDAYVYDLNGAAPDVPAAKLVSPRLDTTDSFGAAVAIAGKRLVVGAPGDDTGRRYAGAAYIYDLASATPPIPTLTLTNPTGISTLGFGSAVGASASRVMVGDPLLSAGGVNAGAGAAYVYDWSSATPALTLTNPSPARDARFGQSMALGGTLAVIGAPTAARSNVGSAYVFDLANATPAVPIVSLTDPTPPPSDYLGLVRFGFSVAIAGTRIVVGDYKVAYVYDITGATPAVPFATLTNPAPNTSDSFGAAVAMSGSRVAVGAPSGLVYVYDLAAATPDVPVFTLANPKPQGYDYFGYSVAISGTRIVVGAMVSDVGATNSGRAYVYDLASATPMLPIAALDNPSPSKDDTFGRAVAIDGTMAVIGAPADDTNGEDRGAAYVFSIRPILRIVPAAPGLVHLSWSPTNMPGFVLQYADSLAPVSWGNSASGETNPVTFPTSNPHRLYRLYQP